MPVTRKKLPKKKIVAREQKPTRANGKDIRTRTDKIAEAYAREQRRTHVLELFARGYPPTMIAKEVSSDPRTVERDIEHASNALLRYFAEPKIQHTFVRFAAFNLSIIDKLQLLYESFMMDGSEKKNYSAAVSSLKAQSDVLDRVLDKGMEWGVIDKRKASRTVHRPKGDLQKELRSQIRTLSVLLTRVSDEQQTKPIATTKRHTKQQRYTRIIRKCVRDQYGIVFHAQSWQFQSGVRRQHQSNPNQQHQETQMHITLKEELTTLTEIKNSPSRKKKKQKKVIDVSAEQTKLPQLMDGKTWLVEPVQAPE